MTDAHTRSQRHRRLALLCCLGAGFGTLVDASVITYTVPYLGSELQAETNGVQWFLAAYSLSFGLGLVPGGRLGDVYGRRGLFIVGLAIFVLGAVASGLAPTIWIAVAGRLVQGSAPWWMPPSSPTRCRTWAPNLWPRPTGCSGSWPRTR